MPFIIETQIPHLSLDYADFLLAACIPPEAGRRKDADSSNAAGDIKKLNKIVGISSLELAEI